MATGSVFSQTLQSITTAKLSELSNKRATFDSRHSEIINGLQTQTDPLARVTSLLEGVKHCFDIDTSIKAPDGNKGQSGQDQQVESDLRRLDRFLEQAKFDPSLSKTILSEWEQMLVRHLDVQSQRFQYATLYGQLVTEWLSPGRKQDAAATGPSADIEMGDGFEELPERKRLEARERFETSVFTPANVNEGDIKQYLDDLFSDEEGSVGRNTSKALADLRESAQKFEVKLAQPNQFNINTVARSIKGLLKGDLFTGEKRTVLKDFQTNSTIRQEIADVLNMRMSALSTWSWGKDGVPIEQRRKLNGSFDIFMHEDLLQAIFLQFLGVQWSVFFKKEFGEFRYDAWKSNFKQISRIERKRREYYLGPQETEEVLARKRRRTYRKDYFVYHLLDSPEQEIELKDGEEEAELESEKPKRTGGHRSGPGRQLCSKAARKSAPSSGPVSGPGNRKRHRKVHVAQADDEESEGDDSDRRAEKKPMERKQNLLHLLATEAAVNKRLNGSFTAFRSVFDDLQNSLPHQAIMIILEFFGVSKKWLEFFRTYLEAPLRFLEDDESNAEPRGRKRGAPTSHSLSDVFSEAMLFCVDFTINRRTNGAFLYRLADDFWFWSHDHGKALTAWKEVQRFARTMSLPLSDAKSGSVSITKSHEEDVAFGAELPTGRIRWGMLYFDRDTLRFKIDQSIVDEHILTLKKQLAAKESVFDWVQAWNAYNTFFASNFGKAANCFGREHVDEILATHQRIQKTVFDGRNAVQHLKSMMEERFGIQNLADGFIFFPIEMGGLEFHSPFVSPLQIRDSLAVTPMKILEEFELNEREDYEERKAEFEKGNDPEGRDEVKEPNWKPSEGADEFMSFEEFTRYREEFTTFDAENFLLTAYEELMETPAEVSLKFGSPEVLQALKYVMMQKRTGGMHGEWTTMDAYWKWISTLYGPEMIERFGGLIVVESGLLPSGMVGLFRDQKVKWQG